MLHHWWLNMVTDINLRKYIYPKKEAQCIFEHSDLASCPFCNTYLLRSI